MSDADALPAEVSQLLDGFAQCEADGRAVTAADVHRDGTQVWFWSFPPERVLPLAEFCAGKLRLPRRPAKRAGVVARLDVAGRPFDVVENGPEEAARVLNAFPAAPGAADLRPGRPFARSFTVVSGTAAASAEAIDASLHSRAPKRLTGLRLRFRPAGAATEVPAPPPPPPGARKRHRNGGVGGVGSGEDVDDDDDDDDAEERARRKRAKREKKSKKEKKSKRKKSSDA